MEENQNSLSLILQKIKVVVNEMLGLKKETFDLKTKVKTTEDKEKEEEIREKIAKMK